MDFDSRLVLLDGFVIFTRVEVSVSLKRDRETSFSRRASVATWGWWQKWHGTEEERTASFRFSASARLASTRSARLRALASACSSLLAGFVEIVAVTVPLDLVLCLLVRLGAISNV